MEQRHSQIYNHVPDFMFSIIIKYDYYLHGSSEVQGIQNNQFIDSATLIPGDYAALNSRKNIIV